MSTNTKVKPAKAKAVKVIKKYEVSKKIIKIQPNNKSNQELCSNGNNINTIYHIADIHISKVEDRHDEFMSVFKNLANEIRKDTTDALIVICGDILHEKNVLSPSQIMLAKKFFIMLAELCPCIVIIGNHDINPYGNTIDSISPIITNLETVHKIHLLLDDQIYYYNNLIFGLTTLFTNDVTPCNVTSRYIIKIGLYHGTLKNIFNKDENQAYSMIPGKYEISEFKKYYDYVLLGDIHKHMYLDKQKTIAYCGSLLQTRMGEDLLDHGVIKWNLLTGKSKLIRIHNDWGFLKIRCDQNGLNKDDMKLMPKFPVIVMEYQNITSSDAEEHLTKIREKYNAKCSLVRIINDKMDIKIGKGTQQIDLIKIDDNDLVMRLITNFINTNSKQNDTDQTNLINRISSILKGINFNYANSVKKLVIKDLKFDNFFNYGESNKINYERLSGIVGINGNSYVGKSTLACDVLLYSLFGKCSRGDKYDTINVNKSHMSTDIEFEINGEPYRIVRTREKGRSKTYNQSSEKVDLYKAGVIISKETVDQTNKYIQQLLCSYSDFINIAFMMQNKTVSFIDMQDKDRKSLVCDLLKLNVFNDIVSHAKKQISQHVYILSHMKDKIGGTRSKRDTFDKNICINNINKTIQQNQEEFDTIQKSLQSVSQELNKVNRTKIETDLKLSEFTENYKDLIESKTQHDLNLKKIQNAINDITKYQKQIKDNTKSIDLKTKQLNIQLKCSKAFGNIDDVYNKFNQTNMNDRKIIENEIQSLLMQHTELNKTYDDKTIKQYTLTLNALKTSITEHKKQMECTKKLIVYMTKPFNLDKFYNRSADIKSEISNTTELIDKIKLEIEHLESKSKKLSSHQFDINCKFCMSYSVTKDKLRYEKYIKIKKIKLENSKKKIIILTDLFSIYEKYQKLHESFYKGEEDNNRHRNTIVHIQNTILTLDKDIEKISNIINTHNKNILIEENNKELKTKRIKLSDQLKDIDNRNCGEYEQYQLVQQQIIKLNNEIQELTGQNEKMHLMIEKLQHSNTVCEADNKNIDDLDQKIASYEKLKDESKIINSHYTRISKLYESKQQESKLIENTLAKTKFELDTLTDIVQEYTKKEKDKALLETLIQILDKNGLIDNILSTIVSPKIESNLNQLLKHIVDYNVKISYSKGKFQISKIIGTKVINIETLSGCEKFITDICFKMVLDQYNSYVKPGFIVMDEVFTCCDDENVSKLPAMLNYIKNHYKYAMLISHDERIKKLCDTTINVIKTSTGSKILHA